MSVEIYQSLRMSLQTEKSDYRSGRRGWFCTGCEGFQGDSGTDHGGIEKRGYRPGKEIGIAIDAAASELYDEEKDGYCFSWRKSDDWKRSITGQSNEMIHYYENLLDQDFLLCLSRTDFRRMTGRAGRTMTKRLGSHLQLVGDDLFVTNIKRLSCGIRLDAANAILIKVNQIGTVTESLEAVELAHGQDIALSYPTVPVKRRTLLLPILQWQLVQGRSRLVHHVVQIEMPSTISFCESMSSWVDCRCMRIHLPDLKKSIA